MATQAPPRGAGQNPAYRPAHRHRTIPDRRARVWLRSDERPKGCRHRSPLPKERSVTNALPVPPTDRKGGRPNLGRTHKAGANPLTSGQTDQSLAVGGSIAPQRLCPFLSFRATAVAAEDRGRGGPPRQRPGTPQVDAPTARRLEVESREVATPEHKEGAAPPKGSPPLTSIVARTKQSEIEPTSPNRHNGRTTFNTANPLRGRAGPVTSCLSPGGGPAASLCAGSALVGRRITPPPRRGRPSGTDPGPGQSDGGE